MKKFLLLFCALCLAGCSPKKEVSLLPTIDVAYVLEQLSDPTPEPTPTPNYNVLDVAGLTSSKDETGALWVSPEIINRSNETIDAVDFMIRCTDAYGEDVKEWGWGYEYTYQEAIPPGEGIPEDKRFSLGKLENVKTILISVTRYHTVAGETFNIPPAQWDWHSYH